MIDSLLKDLESPESFWLTPDRGYEKDPKFCTSINFDLLPIYAGPNLKVCFERPISSISERFYLRNYDHEDFLHILNFKSNSSISRPVVASLYLSFPYLLDLDPNTPEKFMELKVVFPLDPEETMKLLHSKTDTLSYVYHTLHAHYDYCRNLVNDYCYKKSLEFPDNKKIPIPDWIEKSHQESDSEKKAP